MKKKEGSQTVKNNGKPTESLLDEACDESFPASDPLAWNLGISEDERLSNSKNSIAQQLIYEHAFIKKIMHSISVLSHDISAKQKIDFEALDLLEKFFIMFVEKFHHQKEDLLYGTLAKEKKSTSQYIINDLIHEHQYGKELLSKLHKLANQKEMRHDKTEINNLLKEIQHFYLTHVEKEEEYILPIIQHLNDKTQQNVLMQFNNIQISFDDNEFTYLLNLAEKEVD